MFQRLHHIAIICSDYRRSRDFYTNLLGFEIIRETYRQERNSYKLDLGLNGEYLLELFSFPYPPSRPSGPEATGLRHLSFEVNDLATTIESLLGKGIVCEAPRKDEHTGKRFTFFRDPDNLPIEIYEA